MNNFFNIEFHDLKMCANWSQPLKILWYKLPEFENVFEILLKKIYQVIYIYPSHKFSSKTENLYDWQDDVRSSLYTHSDVPI
jgi:hypothetical protein